MQEIIDSISKAEDKSAQIKADALRKAGEITRNAEERCFEIASLSEAECKAYREKRIKRAEEDAQKAYDNEITVKGAEASKYASNCLKNVSGVVNDIVRRITRGGC